MDGFAFADVEKGGVFVIDVFAERRAASLDAGLDVEGRDFQQNLRTLKLNHATARRQITSSPK